MEADDRAGPAAIPLGWSGRPGPQPGDGHRRGDSPRMDSEEKWRRNDEVNLPTCLAFAGAYETRWSRAA